MKIEELIGRRNYEKRLKENPSEYGYPTSLKTQRTKLSNLLQESINRKTNSYKNNIIPIMYIDTNKKNKSGEDIIALTKKSKSNNDLPYTEYYRGALNKPLARTRTTVGHELGHAKYHIYMKELNSKLEDAEKKNKNFFIAKILKMRKYKLEDNYSKNKEAIADKNISKYLKQMGLSKRDRQAHYYLRKSEPPKNEGRYKGKLGSLKYLKDYTFGFSLLPDDYNLYKSMTHEWKEMMREHFYNIYFSVWEYIASIKDFKNREKDRTGKTLNDTDWSLRTNLEWRKYLYGGGKRTKLHQDLEYTSKYRDNPEIMDIYMAGKHEGIAEAIRMLQNAGIFSDDDSYISHD